jgi:heavy metal sensor kinase
MNWLPRIARGLRFRLTLTYVLLFTLLLVPIGLYFRANLRNLMEDEVRAVLEEEWGAIKGYLRVEKGRAVWTADTTDPEEGHILDRLRYVHLLADAGGKVLSGSPVYASIGVDSPAEIRRILSLPEPVLHLRYDSAGVPYLIKAGRLPDDRRRPYFLAIGRSLEGSRRTVAQFTRSYFLFLPAIVAATGLLAWLLAGLAIRPVDLVAHAAQKLTGSNLSLKIPARGAGDELDHLIESFNRMTDRLERSFDQIRRFSTDVSHELRTPLTAVRGQLEVALLTAQTMEQFREAALEALAAVEQLSSIVRALLLLSQAESGQVVLQVTPLDLGEVAREVTERFQIPADEKGVRLEAVVEQAVVVAADRVQMERLFSNLVSNAVKYTPGGGSVKVCVDRDPGGSARLRVEDTGAGIPRECLPHIFDRFYRVRDPHTSREQGLGLGLSFVSWIAKAHQGRVTVASEPGKGSTFTVVLPAGDVAHPEPAALAERRAL